MLGFSDHRFPRTQAELFKRPRGLVGEPAQVRPDFVGDVAAAGVDVCARDHQAVVVKQ